MVVVARFPFTEHPKPIGIHWIAPLSERPWHWGTLNARIITHPWAKESPPMRAIVGMGGAYLPTKDIWKEREAERT